jgi:protein arginine kinase activator
MQCHECGSENATVHVKRREGDEEVSIHLCRACAQKMGWHDPLEDAKFPLAHFISSMMQDMSSGLQRDREEEAVARCSECGLSFQEFSRTGRLGCGHCYEAFRPSMEELLRRIHGNTRHRGRRPESSPKERPTAQSTTLRQLKADLDRAIADEDFERAARIRDEIRELKKPRKDGAHQKHRETAS